MTFLLNRRSVAYGLLLGVAIVLNSSAALAQPMSSGSGAGTGTGMSGGAARNSTGTGFESGGPNSTGTGVEAGTGARLPGSGRFDPLPRGRMPQIRPEFSVPAGPGVGVTFPDESDIIPLDLVDQEGTATGPRSSELSIITERQLKYARRIPAAGDRSLALSRIASAATFSNQLDVADGALNDASEAAMQMQPGLVQDQRLISIITALMGLGEARLREGLNDTLAFDLSATPGEENKPAPALPPVDRVKVVRGAQAEWRKAATLAAKITNPTYRNEMLYRVADGMGYGSQTIVNEFQRAGDRPKDATEKSGLERSFEGLPDQILEEAGSIATSIDRPVWHDQALLRVATSAAESRQYSRALAVAHLIPQPEVLTNALLKIAEIQARRGDPKGATSTYREAAVAVASIPQEDPRAVLAGVLIDSLVSVGRFEDARASVRLYPDEPRRMIALGAIAEQMGRRGAGLSALQWINAEAAPQYRSWLYRRVNNGLVAAVEENRRKDLSNRDR
ncbi:MAG: hypothetical protein U0794_20060 [Isosphaeraceae bacterium]